MDDQAKNYFESLVEGKKDKETETETSSAPIDEEISSPSEPEPVASLAKAETVALKPKSKKQKKHIEIVNESGVEEDFSIEPEGQLTVDVFQTPDEIIIQSTVAGVKPEDLTIDITSESVSIKGKREMQDKIKEDDYFYQECYWGRFSRSIILPQEIDPEKADASLKNGVLTIRLPKINRDKAKKLRVKLS